MPNRPWRKCETCEWFEKQQERCHLIAYTRGSDSFYPGKNFWCSEWKSAEPETCAMCEWFFPFGNEQKGACNHSMAQPRNYSRRSGACESFRRKDAD